MSIILVIFSGGLRIFWTLEYLYPAPMSKGSFFQKMKKCPLDPNFCKHFTVPELLSVHKKVQEQLNVHKNWGSDENHNGF